MKRRNSLGGLLNRLQSRLSRRQSTGTIGNHADAHTDSHTHNQAPAPRSPSLSTLSCHHCALLHSSTPISGRLYLTTSMLLFQSTEPLRVRLRLDVELVVAARPCEWKSVDCGVEVVMAGASGSSRFVLVQHRDDVLRTIMEITSTGTCGINTITGTVSVDSTPNMVLDMIQQNYNVSIRTAKSDFMELTADGNMVRLEYERGRTTVSTSDGAILEHLDTPTVPTVPQQESTVEFCFEFWLFFLWPLLRLVYNRYGWGKVLFPLLFTVYYLLFMNHSTTVDTNTVLWFKRRHVIESAKLSGLIHRFTIHNTIT